MDNLKADDYNAKYFFLSQHSSLSTQLSVWIGHDGVLSNSNYSMSNNVTQKSIKHPITMKIMG